MQPSALMVALSFRHEQLWKANIGIGSGDTIYSDPRKFSRRYSVPLETPSTYTQRRLLSESLAEKIGISHENASVSHAVIIHGLGGTGKSQVALKFAEDHMNKYDPVL